MQGYCTFNKFTGNKKGHSKAASEFVLHNTIPWFASLRPLILSIPHLRTFGYGGGINNGNESGIFVGSGNAVFMRLSNILS